MDGAQIREITSEGLTYVDDEGKLQFIDFKACHQNHLAWVMKPENLQEIKEINHMSDKDLEEHIEFEKNWKEIGARYYAAKLPCIAFYTDPPIRFEFADMNEFYRVEGLIRKSRWHTVDMA